MPARDPETDFAVGFLSGQYLLGRRGTELLEPRGLSDPAREASRALARQLSAPERQTRARALASALLRIAEGLDAWRLK